MAEIKDGGPAFPNLAHWSNDQLRYSHEGMTLRDYFAAKALQGMLATAGGPCLHGLDGYESHTANAAYKIADSMLKARMSANSTDQQPTPKEK